MRQGERGAATASTCGASRVRISARGGARRARCRKPTMPRRGSRGPRLVRAVRERLEAGDAGRCLAAHGKNRTLCVLRLDSLDNTDFEISCESFCIFPGLWINPSRSASHSLDPAAAPAVVSVSRTHSMACARLTVAAVLSVSRLPRGASRRLRRHGRGALQRSAERAGSQTRVPETQPSV